MLNNAPDTTARVFSMREFPGLDIGEICKELEITTSNRWVMLHRARMRLRICLQQRWFERGNKMMSCKKATHLLSQQLDRKLSARENMALRFHLMLCAGCTNFNRNMAFLRKACQRIISEITNK